ncbi:MAG: ribulose-phosphate 3-epimerase [Planctomycetaceae bacterium]
MPTNPLTQPRIRIAPSLLASDFSRLRDELQRIESGGADVVHLDVMDGHYVSNISFGIPVIEKIRPVTKLFFDTHLMIDQPRRYAESFVKAGANGITFHTEVVTEPFELIDYLRGLGVTVGVSLNPKTPAIDIEQYLSHVDLVNVMTVEPGFGGQKFLFDMLDKVGELSKRLRPDQRLEVDGGVNAETVERAVAAGADMLVAGTAVFRAPNPGEAIATLRRQAEAVWKRRTA